MIEKPKEATMLYCLTRFPRWTFSWYHTYQAYYFIKVRILVRLVQVLHVHSYTRKGTDKLKLEQCLNDLGRQPPVQVSTSPFALTFHKSI